MRQKVEKKKILLLMLIPILIVGALIFYALGGGRGQAKNLDGAAKGINTALPEAQFKKEVPTDKMGIYDLNKNDTAEANDNGIKDLADKMGFDAQNDPQTKAINDKLAAIYKQVSAPVTSPPPYSRGSSSGFSGADEDNNAKEVARLEKMMKNLQQNGNGADPEMAQLNTLMDKILDAQNSGRAVSRSPKPVDGKADTLFKAIPAVIEGNQKVIEGASVKMRLLDTIVINWQTIPKGTLVYGLAVLSNQRLNLEIKNIGLGNAIIPVSITVFDKKDAMVGLYAPEAVITDAISGGADNALQSMEFIGGMDQSLGVQAAGAGINAAKGLFSKKVKRIKVKLDNNRAVLLRDNTKKFNH
ncbi:conjugative transposon protein TraM [Mucilaginibacter polytrichastri]|uniref:Conjugative transposon TraM C-terminal domain-containing protein n=1 Tax=Mucilaginibacter polytrichastri TaxID=1302689 RepID=A0A1Q5ZWL0_9SPHI|nr:conjugative transposon protein TraM [Mucilaginibacter polytrichastri]OKS86130.1 hypothetical protein RG47T_1580 [Mucilaginibacter polytrichastri]SFS58373.1 Bacteroides conjugative transposon TraM protein [Mucilaginibacter polytrichastri]